MIIQADGCVKHESVAVGSATMIVSTSGVAYRRTTKVKAVVRFIKRYIAPLAKKLEPLFDIFYNIKYHCTRTGKPVSLEPPHNKSFPYF